MVRVPYKDVPNEHPNKLYPERLRWEPMLRLRLLHRHTPSNRIYAYVDSGSPYCLFHMALADLIGLDATKNPLFVDTLRGVVKGETDPLYFHKITLLLDIGHRIEVVAGFAKRISTQGILGRNGFFDAFKVNFDHSTTPPSIEIDKIPTIQ